MTEDEMMERLAKDMEAKFFETLMGPPRKQRQTALRVRGRTFETVEIGDDGKIIEPPPRCCYGTVLHAPNCKTWGIVT